MTKLTTTHESFDDLHQRLLKFVGAFASLQFAMDTMVDHYLRAKMPEFGKVVISVGLDRRTDPERLKLMRAMASAEGYSDEEVLKLTFSTVFNRTKQLRDLVDHSFNIVGPAYHPNHGPHISFTRLRSTKTDKLPNPILPSHVDAFTEQVEWLTEHVYRIGFEAGAGKFLSFSGQPADPEIPGPLPHPQLLHQR